MDGTDHMMRDAGGRFLTGHSGNPAGKLPGTRNRATVLAAALLEGEAEAIARVVVEKALEGDGVAARFCLDRLSPRPRGRAIRLEVPADLGPGGAVVATFNAALAAMAAGEITPEEALAVSRVIEGRWRALRAWRLEEHLTSYDRVIPGDEGGGGKVAGNEAELRSPEEGARPRTASPPTEARHKIGYRPPAFHLHRRATGTTSCDAPSLAP